MKRFFECLIPVTSCNLKCEYCYVIQRHNRLMQMPKFDYSVDRIIEALSMERLGGACYFSICGAGETMLPKETLEITRGLIENGHYVNLTTNGTITNRIKEISSWPKEITSHLHIAFSFHYLELLKHNLLGTYFENVRMARAAGCSILVQINLYDGYNDHWDTIKDLCIKEVGAPPQVAATRDENSEVFKFHTSGTTEEYIKRGKEFDSPLWDFTIENFNNKHNGQFCYAGQWSGTLNLCTGILTGCYGQGITQNIFEDISKPIKFRAIGKNCCKKFCMNSSHFLSLGCIPDYKTPTYASLRNRKVANWYNPAMEKFLSERLYDSNERYSSSKMLMSNIRSLCQRGKLTCANLLRNKFPAIYNLIRKVKKCLKP